MGAGNERGEKWIWGLTTSDTQTARVASAH